MKHFLRKSLLSLALVVSVVGVWGQSHPSFVIDNFRFSPDENGLSCSIGVYGYASDLEGDISIPATATNTWSEYGKEYTFTYTVTEIHSRAFANSTNMTSISIPKTVTTIEERAFFNCPKLISIELPETMTSIGSNMFSKCASLTSIEIPSLVTTIEERAFSGCTSLTSIKIPNSVTSIGIYAFEGCTNLKSIEIPNSVTTIGSFAFVNSGLASVELPNSIKTIESNTFENCPNLASVIIPNSVTSIGSHVFDECKNLISIKIPKSVEEMGNYPFSYYTTDVTVEWENPISTLTLGSTLSHKTLHVPCGTRQLYLAANGWRLFGKIVEDCPPELSVSSSSLDFAATSEQKMFEITSNTAWTVSSDEAWLTVSPTSGNDNGSISVTAAANTVTASRTAVITVSGTDVVAQTITITQAAATIAVSGVSLNSTTATLETGGTQQLTATVSPNNATNKNVTWSSGNTSVATVDANGKVTAVAAGKATITVTTEDGNHKATCEVTVNAPTVAVGGVSLNSTTATLETGGMQQLTATVSPNNATNKNVTWSSGNTSVATVDTNGKVTAVAAGTATITVTTEDGNHKATCEVTVNAPTVPPTPALSISLSSLEFVGAGEEKTFTITSNTAWTVGSGDSWLTITPASGSNNGTVTVTAAANTATAPRTAIITVSATGVEQKIISVTQVATGENPPPTPTLTLSVSASSIGFTGAGEQKTFTVTSNTDWTVASDAAWLTVSPASGSNNGTVAVTAAANTATTARTAIITVSATGVEQKIISVTQAAAGDNPPPAPTPTLSVSSTSLGFSAAGEEKTFTITSNTAWAVASNAAWLTVSPASGSDNGTITVTAAANTATTARTGIVTVSGTGVEAKTITVTQAAAEETLPSPTPPAIVPEETQTVGAEGNGKITLSLSIPTGATLTGSFEITFPNGMALDEELTVLSAELAGNFTLSFTARANNTWLIEIKSKGLRADVPPMPYRKIMDIAYTAGTEVQQGTYEATITNLDFQLSDNTQIEEDLLTVPVHVTQTVTSVESVDSTPFTAYFAGDILRVESGKAERISVYSFAGILLYAADKPEGMIEIPFPSNPGTFCIVRGSRSGVLKVAK
jgi:uncharacterized protein YjdB